MSESISNIATDAASDDVGDLCALCREEKKNPQHLDCGHSFCSTCLEEFKGYRNKQWGRRCPLCRQPIAGTSSASSAVRNVLLLDLTLSDEESTAQDDTIEISSSDSSSSTTDDSSLSENSSTTTDSEATESIPDMDFGNLVYVDEYELAYFESNILTDDELYFYTDSDDTVEGVQC